MGKVTGFLEYERRTPGYRPIVERMQASLAVPMNLDGHQVAVSASVSYAPATLTATLQPTAPLLVQLMPSTRGMA